MNLHLGSQDPQQVKDDSLGFVVAVQKSSPNSYRSSDQMGLANGKLKDVSLIFAATARTLLHPLHKVLENNSTEETRQVPQETS